MLKPTALLATPMSFFAAIPPALSLSLSLLPLSLFALLMDCDPGSLPNLFSRKKSLPLMRIVDNNEECLDCNLQCPERKRSCRSIISLKSYLTETTDSKVTKLCVRV